MSAATSVATSASMSAALAAPGEATPPQTRGPDVQALVDQVHARVAQITEGHNADYIPYLAQVPPGLFAIALATPKGEVFQAGDADSTFPIESISKLFTAVLVIREQGLQELRNRIGAEPSGLAFNSVQAVELHEGRPLNPFVNAGAIATTSLVKARSQEERWQKIHNNMSAFAGRPLSLNVDVFDSEAESNAHNRGLAWLLKSYGYMYSDPTEALNVYTRQCSLNITTRDLALMGSVLAGDGTQPLTGERLIATDDIPPLLAEMALNGLYDSSGIWLFEVGLPAKSGVGGGILAIAPGKFSLAAFSPPLDEFGNSVRAQRAISELAHTLKLNVFRP